VLSLDAVTPRGLALWLTQVVVMWSALRWASRRELLVVAVWTAACADVGFWLSPPSGLPVGIKVANQFLCMTGIFLLLNAGLRQRSAQAALAVTREEVRVLRGLLPICASCKRIRNTKGEWEQMEVYIRTHSEAEFTHGLCPVCIGEQFEGTA